MVRQKPGILILTGLRNGLDSFRNLAGCPVVMLKVETKNTLKTSRSGWTYCPEIDGSANECAVDAPIDWDLVYQNNEGSSDEKVKRFVFEELLPTLFRCLVRHIPNVPSLSMVYKDISGGPMLYPFFLPLWVKLVGWWLSDVPVDAFCSPECLGCSLAVSVASEQAKPFVLIRKEGKICGSVQRASYLGSNITQNRDAPASRALEIVDGAIVPGQRIVLIDDCRATGETMKAVRTLVEKSGGALVAAVFFMEFTQQLQHDSSDIRIFRAVQYEGR